MNDPEQAETTASDRPRVERGAAHPVRDALLVLALLFAITSLMLWRLVWWQWVLFEGDTWMLYYPAKAYMAQMIHQGKLPLWTPNIFFGFPLFAEAQVAALYPLHFVYMILPAATAFNLSIILRFLLAGLFTFLYVRRITQNRWAAAVSAVTFAFGGYMIAQLRHENVEHALIWLPLILLALDHWISGRNRRYLALAGMGLGVSFLAGYFFMALLVLLTATAYYLFLGYSRIRACLPNPRALLVWFGGLAVFGVIGVGLAAVQIIPNYELARESIRAGGLDYQTSTQVSFSPLHLVTFLIPKFFGHPPDGTYWGLWRGNAIDLVAYLGILPLLLLIAAAVFRRDRHTLFFGLVCGGALLIALGPFSPVWRLMNMLPVFSMMRNPARFLSLVAFSGAVLAGLGFDVLFRQTSIPAHRLKRFQQAVVAGAAGFVLICAVSGPAIQWMRGSILSFGQWFVDRFVYAQSIRQQSRAYYYSLIEPFYDQLAQHIYITHAYVYVPVLFMTVSAAFIWYMTTHKKHQALAGIAALLIIGSDLVGFGHEYNQLMPPEVYAQKPYYIEVMEQDSTVYRYGFAPLFGHPRNYDPLLFNRMYIQGYSPIQMQRHADLIEALRPQMEHLAASSHAPLLHLLNIKYIVTGDSLAHGWAKIRFNEGAKVYENRAVMPRAFLVSRAHVAASPAEALAAIADTAFNPWETVILEGEARPDPIPPSGSPARALRAGGSARNDPVQIVRYEADEVLLDVRSGGGYLILTDTYYPGWRAEVDGIEQPILRANYLFRAVYLEPGPHRVRFRYAPFTFTLGAVISILSLSAAATLAFFYRKNPS